MDLTGRYILQKRKNPNDKTMPYGQILGDSGEEELPFQILTETLHTQQQS